MRPLRRLPFAAPLRVGIRGLLVAVALACCCASSAIAADTEELAFVSEYIRQLSANESNRERAEKELEASKAPNEMFAALIRNGTRATLELNTQIHMLKAVRLRKPFDTLPQTIAEFYRQKVQTYYRLIDIASLLIGEPKRGVDYQALMAEAPKLTARMEHLDRGLFEATALVFAVLIDEKPDRNGKVSRLIITRGERDHLVEMLQSSFGDKLDRPSPGFIVGSAAMLRNYLSRKGYNCSDEPQ